MFQHSLSFQDIFSKISSELTLKNFLYGCIVTLQSAFIEEVFFRKYITDKLSKYLSPTKTNIVQAILFSACHFNNVVRGRSSAKIIFPYLFFRGMMYGIMKSLSNSLFIPTLFHSLHNIKVMLHYTITK